MQCNSNQRRIAFSKRVGCFLILKMWLIFWMYLLQNRIDFLSRCTQYFIIHFCSMFITFILIWTPEATWVLESCLCTVLVCRWPTGSGLRAVSLLHCFVSQSVLAVKLHTSAKWSMWRDWNPVNVAEEPVAFTALIIANIRNFCKSALHGGNLCTALASPKLVLYSMKQWVDEHFSLVKTLFNFTIWTNIWAIKKKKFSVCLIAYR